jgi:hypothetical protein
VIEGVRKLIAPLSNLPLLVENPIHGAHGTKVGPFIEQRRVNGPGRPIHEPVGVKNLQDLLALFFGQAPGSNVRLWGIHLGTPSSRPPVVVGPGNTQGFARGS